MHIITRARLVEFWEKHSISKNALLRLRENMQVTESDRYLELLINYPPRPIKTKEQCREVQAQIDIAIGCRILLKSVWLFGEN